MGYVYDWLLFMLQNSLAKRVLHFVYIFWCSDNVYSVAHLVKICVQFSSHQTDSSMQNTRTHTYASANKACSFAQYYMFTPQSCFCGRCFLTV